MKLKNSPVNEGEEIFEALKTAPCVRVYGSIVSSGKGLEPGMPFYGYKVDVVGGYDRKAPLCPRCEGILLFIPILPTNTIFAETE